MSSPLLLECMAALGRTIVTEAYIRKDRADARYYGLQEPGHIWVNPVTPVVEVTIHELLHEIRPDWSESTVAAFTTKLMHQMTDEEIQKVYALYEDRKVQQSRTVDPEA